jgi:hypothetical protein
MRKWQQAWLRQARLVAQEEVLEVTAEVQEAEALLRGAVVDVQAEEWACVVASKAPVSDMALEPALGMALVAASGTTTAMTAHVSMDHGSAPTWAPIHRTLARVGSMKVVDAVGMAAMAAADGTVPIVQGATFGMRRTGSSEDSSKVIRSSRLRYLCRCRFSSSRAINPSSRTINPSSRAINPMCRCHRRSRLAR